MLTHAHTHTKVSQNIFQILIAWLALQIKNQKIDAKWETAFKPILP